MKYLFLLYGEPIPPAGTPEARKLLEDWTAARQGMEDAGVLISCAPLYPPEASTTLRVRGGEALLTDGPAAEIKEQFGGYTLVECANLDEALAWAAKIPTAREGMVEVRPVIEVQAPEAAGQAPGAAGLSGRLEEIFREHWWAAVAVVTRMTGGDLEAAEDAVQEACAAALVQWPAAGVPDRPRGWLIAVARHKALDRIRRESQRPEKEALAPGEAGPPTPAPGEAGGDPLLAGDDQLALVFMCCHPALNLAARVALTLRCVCGLETAQIAAAFLVPEPTMAQRLVRAKRKIRQAGIPLLVPAPAALSGRLDAVLRVIYLVFTEGHLATSGGELVRPDLCEQAIRLARAVAALLPGQPEARGLLALLLLTDARRAARTDDAGALVLLADQDRRRWDAAMITEGRRLVEQALPEGRPGPYQLHAAIAACHADAEVAADTDWPQIVALYDELLKFEPTAVTAANRAAAVAMADSPEAGLAILLELGADPAVARWPQLHLAIAELSRHAGRPAAARDAYAEALRLGLAPAQRAFVRRQQADLPPGRPHP